jgi:hypothetical protein
MAKFSFYTTEIVPTLNPGGANPQPATLVVLDRDPEPEDYEPLAGAEGRGSVTATLGGAVRQDFGFFEEDGRLHFSGRDCMSQSTMGALRTLSRVIGGEFYFTDGYECWRVGFARPNGFRSWLNLLWRREGITVFSYEISLNVITKEIEL